MTYLPIDTKPISTWSLSSEDGRCLAKIIIVISKEIDIEKAQKQASGPGSCEAAGGVIDMVLRIYSNAVLQVCNLVHVL